LIHADHRASSSLVQLRACWRSPSHGIIELVARIGCLALSYELGRLHSLGLLQALILNLRIADGFGQHLAQLSLGLRGFPLGWLPLCHQ
jgi:hypothetical protein